MTAKRNYVSRNQRTYLSFIERNPGCSIADIVRCCKRNPLAGHKWIYDSVHRLEVRGMIWIEYFGNSTKCYLPDDYQPWSPGKLTIPTQEGEQTFRVAYRKGKPYYNRGSRAWVRVPKELERSIRYD